MKRTLAQLALAGLTLTVAPAHATPPTPDMSYWCVDVPAVYVRGERVTTSIHACVPGP